MSLLKLTVVGNELNIECYNSIVARRVLSALRKKRGWKTLGLCGSETLPGDYSNKGIKGVARKHLDSVGEFVTIFNALIKIIKWRIKFNCEINFMMKHSKIGQ